jgi:hypothetical protein
MSTADLVATIHILCTFPFEASLKSRADLLVRYKKAPCKSSIPHVLSNHSCRALPISLKHIARLERSFGELSTASMFGAIAPFIAFIAPVQPNCSRRALSCLECSFGDIHVYGPFSAAFSSYISSSQPSVRIFIVEHYRGSNWLSDRWDQFA